MHTTLITDSSHYTTVLDLAMKAKHSLWIGTADIKDMYVLQGKTEKPFLGVLADLLGKGVEVRLIHAKEPGPNFRADFDRYPRLAKMLERVLCPWVFNTIFSCFFGMIFRSLTSNFIAKYEVILQNLSQNLK
jgi:hypothetical protein